MNKTNLLVDTSILVAFLVAMEPRFSGLAIHEWLGVSLAATILIHLLLHWKWITGVAGRFFQKLWHTARLKFVVDSLLFVDFVAIIMSGIMISRVVLPSLGLSIAQAGVSWRALHSWAADTGILLVGLHFALNWGWVVSTVRRLIVNPARRLVRPAPVLQPVPIRSRKQDPYRGGSHD